MITYSYQNPDMVNTEGHAVDAMAAFIIDFLLITSKY
jgi:hypothetical protein